MIRVGVDITFDILEFMLPDYVPITSSQRFNINMFDLLVTLFNALVVESMLHSN